MSKEELPRDMKVLYRFKTTEADKVTEFDDLAEEYVVFECPECSCGVIVYGYAARRQEWVANWSGRAVIRRLLIEREKQCTNT